MNLDPTPPDTLDLSTVLIWPSCPDTTAATVQEKNLQIIAERKAVLHLVLDFIGTHRLALAGTYWKVCYLDPEIEIWCRSHHDKTGMETAAEIARRWPQARWKRVSPKWESEVKKGFRNWEATVDGVTLRIEHAEKFEPIPLPPDGDIDVMPPEAAQVALA